MSARRTAAAAALVIAAGLAVAHVATDGYAAYTLESARRLAALRDPRPVPALALELADGGRANLSALPGRVLLVDFIYTRCPTYCTAMGSVYARLKDALAPEIAAGQVQLLSITFDPVHDDAGALRAYRARFSPDRAGWALGVPAHATDLPRWLETFGVVVIPDGIGGYTHNAAVHVVTPDRRLAAILDFDDVEGIAAKARGIAAGEARHAALR